LNHSKLLCAISEFVALNSSHVSYDAPCHTTVMLEVIIIYDVTMTFLIWSLVNCRGLIM